MPCSTVFAFPSHCRRELAQPGVPRTGPTSRDNRHSQPGCCQERMRRPGSCTGSGAPAVCCRCRWPGGRCKGGRGFAAFACLFPRHLWSAATFSPGSQHVWRSIRPPWDSSCLESTWVDSYQAHPVSLCSGSIPGGVFIGGDGRLSTKGASDNRHARPTWIMSPDWRKSVFLLPSSYTMVRDG